MKRKSIAIVISNYVCALAFVFAQGSARGDQVVSTFDSSDEGWTYATFDLGSNNYTTIQSSGQVQYNSTGGNPGGYIGLSSDPDSYYTMFSAPTKFLGDQSGAFSLSYDIFDKDNSSPLYSDADVMLYGANGTRLIYHDSGIQPGTSWTHVSINIGPSSDWHLGSVSGATASASDFAGVLGNLANLYVRVEYNNGPDNMGLDNVILSVNPVPEPSSIAMGLTSGGALALLGWKRRRRGRRLINDRDTA